MTFKTTWQANQGYFDKLATLTAGGDAPDIFQIDDNYLTEYAGRGVTLDLTSYQTSGKLDMTKFPESLWKYGVVDGKLVGVAFGENTPGMVYNKTKLDRARRRAEPQTGMELGRADHAGAPTVTTKSDGKVLRHHGPERRLQGALDVAAPAGQGALQRQAARLHRGGPGRAGSSCGRAPATRKAAPPADIIHEANGGDVTKQLVVTGKARHLVHVGQPDARAAEEHQGRAGRGRLPGRPERPVGPRLDVLLGLQGQRATGTWRST